MRAGFLIAIVIAVPLLSGCDNAADTMFGRFAHQPTIVIPPGYKIALEGKAAPVFGFDKCPEPDSFARWFSGSLSADGSSHCIVILPETHAVQVRVAIDGKLVDETWTVEWTGEKPERAYFLRPGGMPVIQYAANEGHPGSGSSREPVRKAD